MRLTSRRVRLSAVTVAPPSARVHRDVELQQIHDRNHDSRQDPGSEVV
jgi:hypothetical protein